MSDLSTLNLEPGEVVGGYTLISRLGSGAMGSVWRVRDDGGQSYAMKILRDSLADDTDSSAGNQGAAADPDLKENVTPRERLRREALALKKINHPGVCGIVDMELDDSLAFIVTELIDGKNLRDDVAANGRYTGDDLERLARKLIEAVRAVHAAGIVHRDIKPTNVMVSASGPVLVDFGIAMGEGESHVTRTGLVMGTPGFIAPEIIEGAESDETTDWWSVASVLAFAATGAPVFGTKPMMAVLEREARGNANLTGLPAGTMAAFRSALSPDRTQRCSPDQLLQAIAFDAWHSQSNPLGGAAAGAPTIATLSAANGETEAMPPFGLAGSAGSADTVRSAGTVGSADTTGTANIVDIDNPRTLWRASDALHGTGAPVSTLDAGPTQVLADVTTPLADTTTPMAGTTSSPDATTPLADATAPLTGATTPLTSATTPLAERTAVMPSFTPQPAQPAMSQATLPLNPQQPYPGFPGAPQPPAVAPQVRPALQNIIDHTAQVAPTEAMIQQSAPNPADLKRGSYLQRATLPILLLALPLAILAAIMPLAAVTASAAITWLLLTLGCNAESQLERESRRGGTRKSDTWIRAASLPWHVVKALLMTIPRTLLAVIIALLCAAAGTLVLNLPTQILLWPINPSGSWTIPLPLLTDISNSFSGITLGCAMAVGWLVSSFGPQSMLLRLGAGVMRGLARKQPADNPSPLTFDGAPAPTPQPTPRHSGRSAMLLTLWAIVTALLGAMILLGTSISWAPLI
ncbi:Protein kinase [Bifidobacterium sp. DSM 109957]|uniref:non-specific serine/threonine protein kinase n=2 Tax=Bifidobacterium oedipodis TaxID=2675322 RepID=A0A7Y0EQZ4_9BIFI|nr:Protein kinase [Bifidobacterium sp. DSM 109957]